MSNFVNVIGAGLAGCEAAYQLIKRGIPVKLWEMKPEKKSPAHSNDKFAELVCSNSLRSDKLSNAVGLLKEEMRTIDSLIMTAAEQTKVAAGGALAVDRLKFSEYITDFLENSDLVEIKNAEVCSLSQFTDEKVIVCTGPLTSESLFADIAEKTGKEHLYFFDAAAPIVSFASIDMSKAFFASRYDDGKDYINCPMTKEEYFAFFEAISGAECAELKDFEHNVFEGCMPIEEIAARGPMTMCFGPLKPKGIIDPKTGKEPFANVQLRRENESGTMFNIVGFQTHLKFPEQRRVFSMIPGLENAEFLRYGVMHRNTYILSPVLLDKFYRMKENENIYFAGQMTGVEGYIESAASGMLAGISCVCDIKGLERIEFSKNTAIGALGAYISEANPVNFQPMNVNYGIINPLDKKIKNKEQKNLEIASRSLEEIKCLKEQLSAL